MLLSFPNNKGLSIIKKKTKLMKLKKLFFLKKFSELTKIKNNNIKNIKIETLSR